MPPAGSSPAAQHSEGLNRDATFSPKESTVNGTHPQPSGPPPRN